MNAVLWIIASLLALAFLAEGVMKIALPKAKLVAVGQGWAEDFTQRTVMGIGVLEVLGAVGLVLPALLGVATVLVPLAATGIAALMVGAAFVHTRRAEKAGVAVTVVIAALARFGAFG